MTPPIHLPRESVGRTRLDLRDPILDRQLQPLEFTEPFRIEAREALFLRDPEIEIPMQIS